MFSWFGVGIGEVALRMDDSCHGQSVDRFWVADSVSSCEAAFGFDAHQGSTAKNSLDRIIVHESGGHAGDGESGDRASAHGVNVRERIGGGDSTVELGVVNDGGEKIRGLDQSDFIGEFKHASVIRGG